MAEFLFVFGSDKSSVPFNMGCNHHGCRIGKAHHSFKLQSQVLFSLMLSVTPPTSDLCTGPTTLATTGKLVRRANASTSSLLPDKIRRPQKCLPHAKCFVQSEGNVTIVGNGINNPADSRYVDPIKFHLIARRTGSIHDP